MRSMLWMILAAAGCAAQPLITDLQPRGLQKGRPFTLTVIGRGLAEGAKIESSLPGTFTPLGTEKGTMGSSFLVEPSADVAVGVYSVRVITPDGISNVQLFSIGSFPEYNEDESRAGGLPHSNDTIESAQPLPSGPLTMNGKLVGPERDVYRISAKAGEKRVIEVEARRCGSAIDPVIELEDQAGNVLARSEDALLLGLDARLDVTFPKDGYYYVVLRDARYSTQTANFYRLKVGTYGYPQEVFPLGGRRGETVKVSLGAQTVSVDLRNAAKDIHQIPVNLPDSPALPLPFAVGDDPEVMEPVAAPLAVPVTINGRIAKAGEVDRYQIALTSQEPLTISIQARELGTSKLMAVVSVFDEKGVKLGHVGDEPLLEDVYNVNQSRTAGDPEIRIQPPPGARNISVAVEDLARRGGAAFAYRLKVRKVSQDIRLILNTPYINVPAGGSVAVPVTVERHGYDGDVHLSVLNAPKGLKVEGGYVVGLPPIKETFRNRSSAGVLIITAEAAARLDEAQLTVQGSAELTGGVRLVREAEGPGMMVIVAGATEQGSVDRQRPLTAPWLNLRLPAAISRPQAATLQVEMLERKRMEEGDQLKFRWTWHSSNPEQLLPKNVGPQMPGALDIRVIDSKVDPKDPSTGTFVITTTKLTHPATYDLYLTGRLMVDGQQQDIVSRPIQVEVMEVESRSATKSDSGR